MKKLLICCSLLILNLQAELPEAPLDIKLYNEIATIYRTDLPALFNALSPEERIMVYYLYRASLPGNDICTGQTHRDAQEIIELCRTLLTNKNILAAQTDTLPFDVNQFIEQLETYLVYLWSNHGHYFMREQTNDKRTPALIGLNLITPNNLISALTALGNDKATETITRLSPSIFNHTIEPTSSVAGSINDSALNFYSADFTDEDFKRLPLEEQSYANSYCMINYENDNRVPQVIPYKVGGMYDLELSNCLYWLQKATELAHKYPQFFDSHFAKSLELFCDFLKTGDEELFKQHSIEWLKTNNRIDYTIGFIEGYLDPKGYRGYFQADVTIKSIDMEKVNAILPMLEARLPFPDEFKRDNLLDGGAQCPNASINVKAFTAGHMGPQNKILAYCLPNYADIRTSHGSKQIIYASEQSIGERLNPMLYEKLFHLPEDRNWAHQHDPEYALRKTIMMLQVILHETLGHGSGKLAKHTFIEGDPLTIDNKTYKIGDSIPVTNTNEPLILGEYAAALEELRAEIIALYSSIESIDELSKAGLLGNWPSKVTKEKLITTMIQDMVEYTFSKWLSLPNDSCHVSGAHHRANTTILYYLLDHDGIELVEEPIIIDGKEHTVLGIRITSINNTLSAIKDLAIKVQTIKSTADRVGAKQLFETYGSTVRNPHHVGLLKNNREIVNGSVKTTVSIFPYYKPVYDEQGTIIDCVASWPNNFIEQQLEYEHLMQDNNEYE